jgi:hypothetical protein
MAHTQTRRGSGRSGWCMTGYCVGKKLPAGSMACPVGDSCSCECHKKEES